MRALRALASDAGVRTCVYVFVVSRVIVLSLLVLGNAVTVPTPDPDSGIYEPDIVIHGPADAVAHLRRAVDVGDATWYLVIAIYGYEQAPFDASAQHNWAFFPLYPLLVHVVAAVTREFQLTAVAVSNLCFLGALLLLHRFSRARGLDVETADRAVAYMAFYPSAYFFSLPTTESLFVLVTLASFLAAQHGRWWLAGVCGAFASATRPLGILIMLALGASARRVVQLLGVLLVPLGLLAFVALLARDTGNPLAFRDVQAAWGRQVEVLDAPGTLLDLLHHPADLSRSWDFRILNVAATVLALGSVAVLARRRQLDLALYTLAGAVLPLSTGSFQAMSRYVMVLFPVFLVLGEAGRVRPVDGVIRTAFAVLLGLLTALFGARFTIAMA
jgi:hypothetical protein